jgi:hypothetical protein
MMHAPFPWKLTKPSRPPTPLKNLEGAEHLDRTSLHACVVDITLTRRIAWPLIIFLVSTLFGEMTASGQEPIAGNHSRVITIGRDTTFVTDPQREDGTIDYPKWLNQHMGDGASPENNAMVLIYQATGRLGQPDRVFEMIGAPALEPIEQVFKSWLKPKSKVFQAAKIKPWKANNDPELNQWLETNSKAMEIVREASFREHFYSPLICDDTQIIFNISYPHLDATREMAHAFAIRAMMHLGENDIANAWSDLLVTHRLGRLFGRGFSLMHLQVGYDIENLAMRGELQVLSMIPSSSDLTPYRRDLETLPQRMPFADKIQYGERMMLLDLVSKVATGKSDITEMTSIVTDYDEVRDLLIELGEHSIDWNRVLREINDVMDQSVDAFQQPDYRQRWSRYSVQMGLSKADLEESLFQPQSIKTLDRTKLNDWLAPWLAYSLVVLYGTDSRTETEQYTIHLKVTFALIEWYREHGYYPESLNALYPNLLDSEPMDLFAEEPLTYKRTETGCFFSSVGSDGPYINSEDLMVTLGYR